MESRTFLKIYDAYEDVLFNILHGVIKDHTINSDLLLNYAKLAFKMSDSKHSEILDRAKLREPVEKNVEGQKESAYNLSSEIDQFEGAEAHCCVLKVLLKHQLESSQTAQFQWDGKFGFRAKSILLLHSESKHLTEVNIAFAQWAAFAEIHTQHPLNLAVFIKTLDSIVEINDEMDYRNHSLPIFFSPNISTLSKDKKLSLATPPSFDNLKTDDELIINMFWNATKVFSNSIGEFIGKLHEEGDLKILTIEILKNAFIIINKIKKIETSEAKTRISFEESIKESITRETSKYLSNLVNKTSLESADNEVRVNELIRIMESANADYMKLKRRYGSFFEK